MTAAFSCLCNEHRCHHTWRPIRSSLTALLSHPATLRLIAFALCAATRRCRLTRYHAKQSQMKTSCTVTWRLCGIERCLHACVPQPYRWSRRCPFPPHPRKLPVLRSCLRQLCTIHWTMRGCHLPFVCWKRTPRRPGRNALLSCAYFCCSSPFSLRLPTCQVEKWESSRQASPWWILSSLLLLLVSLLSPCSKRSSVCVWFAFFVWLCGCVFLF